MGRFGRGEKLICYCSASAICASGLAKLGNTVTFAGKVGADAWGDLCRSSLAAVGVDTSRVVSDPTLKTGITVSITSPRDRALVTYLGSIAALRAEEIALAGLDEFTHLHVSSFFLQQRLRPGLKGLLAAAHRCGLTTSLDPGCDPDGRWGPDLRDVLEEVDVFLPNEVELAGVTGCGEVEPALRNLANTRTLIVAKLGCRGCAALENGTLVTIPAFQVKPVDTTGAGDSFNAGILHAWLRNQPLREAMQFAAACGALSTLGSGGTGNQATEGSARAFIAGQSTGSPQLGAY